MLVVFTIIFFFSMLLLLIGYRNVSSNIRFGSLKGRMEALELDVKMQGPDTIFSTLYFDRDYEKEFDEYWEFADCYQAFIRGRYADDPTGEIELLENYSENSKNSQWAMAAKKYIQIINEDDKSNSPSH